MKQKQMKIMIAVVAFVCLCLCAGICMRSTRTVQISGVRVSWVDFNRAYCGPAEERIPAEECESYSKGECTIDQCGSYRRGTIHDGFGNG